MSKQDAVHVDLSEEQWATVKVALGGQIADLERRLRESEAAQEGLAALVDKVASYSHDPDLMWFLTEHPTRSNRFLAEELVRLECALADSPGTGLQAALNRVDSRFRLASDDCHRKWGHGGLWKDCTLITCANDKAALELLEPHIGGSDG